MLINKDGGNAPHGAIGDMKKYVWTTKAELEAKNRGLEKRRAGAIATCGYGYVSGQIAQAWLKIGYIESVPAEPTEEEILEMQRPKI